MIKKIDFEYSQKYEIDVITKKINEIIDVLNHITQEP